MEPSTFAWLVPHGVATECQILGPGWRSWNRTKAVQLQGYCGWRILIGPKKTVKLGRVQFFGAKKSSNDTVPKAATIWTSFSEDALKPLKLWTFFKGPVRSRQWLKNDFILRLVEMELC